MTNFLNETTLIDGLILVIFPNDILLLNSLDGGVRNDLRTTLNLLQDLLFKINSEKLVMNPAKTTKYLGMIVDP